VARARHPGVHDGRDAWLARGDVLRPRSGVALVLDAVDERAPVLAGVAEVVVGRHVLGVARGGRGEPAVEADGFAARLDPRAVDEAKDLPGHGGGGGLRRGRADRRRRGLGRGLRRGLGRRSGLRRRVRAPRRRRGGGGARADRPVRRGGRGRVRRPLRGRGGGAGRVGGGLERGDVEVVAGGQAAECEGGQRRGAEGMASGTHGSPGRRACGPAIRTCARKGGAEPAGFGP
jgi:hypothetical protein